MRSKGLIILAILFLFLWLFFFWGLFLCWNPGEPAPSLIKGDLLSRDLFGRKLKIFIYDSPPEITTSLASFQYYSPSPSPSSCSLGPGNEMFSMERHLHLLLLASSLRTEVMEEADFFLVPAYPDLYMCSLAVMENRTYDPFDFERALWIAYNSVKDGFYWKRKQGKDHLFVITHGWGPSATPGPINDHAIRLVSNGDLSLGITLGRDVVIPPYVGQLAWEVGGRFFQRKQRPILASFKGLIKNQWSHGGGIRQLWQELFKESSEIRIINDRDSPYLEAIDSIFCLCPPGLALWTPRPVESLYFGCIPVIFGDTLVLPFQDLLDWSEFSIKLSFEDAPRVREILLSIPEETILKKQERIEQVFPWFTFDRSYREREKDLVQLLAASLLRIKMAQKAVVGATWR